MNQSYILECGSRKVEGRTLLAAVFVLVLALAVFVPTNAYGMHQTESVKWQLIMISSYPACSNYHYQMTERYNEITEEYFKLYQFANDNYNPECMTEEDYLKYEAREDVDLLIIVFDRNKGRDQLNPLNMGGFYSHVGDEWTHNHTIVFCDCPNFDYSDPSWILSHELSHFILYYLGFDRSIVEDNVHAIDAKSDYCVEVSYESGTCNQLRMHMDTSNHYVTVMPPYQQAIGMSPLLEPQIENIEDSKYRMDMQLEITNWWMDGKITDEDYAKSVEILLEKMGRTFEDTRTFFSAESPNVVFTDPPLDLKGDSTLHTESLNLTEAKSQEILEMNPFGDEYAKSLAKKDEYKLPEWFKTRALWWASDSLSDIEFLKGMEFLYRQ